MKRSRISAAILAGGKSRRFGEDKALLKIEGRSVLPDLVARLGELFDPVRVIVDQAGKVELGSAQVFQDRVIGLGPLGGLLTALENSPTPLCFVAACDMPFLDLKVISFLTAQLQTEDILVPSIGGREEPLTAFYSVRCIGPIQACLEKGGRSIRAIWPEVDTRVVELQGHFPLEQLRRCFLNLNVYPQDLQVALKMIKSNYSEDNG